MHTITLTDKELDVLHTIFKKVDTRKHTNELELKKIDLLRRYKHIMPDFVAIAKIGKGEGIWSSSTHYSSLHYPLERLAIKAGLYTPPAS